MYATDDIVKGNLLLITWTLYRFSVQIYLNTQKSPGGHAKNSVTSHLLKSVKFCWLVNVQ